MRASVNFSPKYCSAVAEKAMKHPVAFIYHEEMSIFLGSKNALTRV